MKRLLNTIAFVCFALFALAQAPQSVCYQGGATDAEGTALANQDINIRASIVRGSANGIIEWSETHAPTTDEFGLFDINVGEGTRTGGQQQAFSDIDWGSGDYFLQIEMDASGGENYEMMGTTQILSVPYALFSEGANTAVNAQTAVVASRADSADVAVALSGENDISNENELQTLTQSGDSLSLSDGNTIFLNVADADADSTNELQSLSFENGVLGISGGNSINTREMAFQAPGASSDFPMGVIGQHLVITDGNYQVPAGKTFFMTAGPSQIILNGHGNSQGMHRHNTTPNMPMFGENTSITDCFCTGILLDNITEVTPVIIDFFESPSYTVPTNKILFIKSGLANDLPGWLIVNNQQMEFFRPNFTRGTRIISFPEFTVLRKPEAFEEMVLTGYLIDKDL